MGITSKFFWRRLFPSLLLVSSFVVLYESTVSDSRYAARQAELLEGELKPAPGTRLQFTATAYCKGQTTASGVEVRSGVAAADPGLLPVGSVIQADFEMAEYNGVYTVMDTGPEIQGRNIDVYMWSCFEALRFGRQSVHIVVLRLGWDPKDSTPLIQTLFHRRTPGDVDEESRPSLPPKLSKPPQEPTRSAAPLPNPTFEKPSNGEPDAPQPAANPES
jgi:3D (Asp-Asp-Asp) domain-containing protein